MYLLFFRYWFYDYRLYILDLNWVNICSSTCLFYCYLYTNYYNSDRLISPYTLSYDTPLFINSISQFANSCWFYCLNCYIIIWSYLFLFTILPLINSCSSCSFLTYNFLYSSIRFLTWSSFSLSLGKKV